MWSDGAVAVFARCICAWDIRSANATNRTFSDAFDFDPSLGALVCSAWQYEHFLEWRVFRDRVGRGGGKDRGQNGYIAVTANRFNA